jgi:hypothetical protein
MFLPVSGTRMRSHGFKEILHILHDLLKQRNVFELVKMDLDVMTCFVMTIATIKMEKLKFTDDGSITFNDNIDIVLSFNELNRKRRIDLAKRHF